MLCYLIKPSTMTDKEMESPECMKQIKVQVGELRNKLMVLQRSVHHIGSSGICGPKKRNENHVALITGSPSGPLPAEPTLTPP